MATSRQTKNKIQAVRKITFIPLRAPYLQTTTTYNNIQHAHACGPVCYACRECVAHLELDTLTLSPTPQQCSKQAQLQASQRGVRTQECGRYAHTASSHPRSAFGSISPSRRDWRGRMWFRVVRPTDSDVRVRPTAAVQCAAKIVGHGAAWTRKHQGTVQSSAARPRRVSGVPSQELILRRNISQPEASCC